MRTEKLRISEEIGAKKKKRQEMEGGSVRGKGQK